jgi:hypothetical protein
MPPTAGPAITPTEEYVIAGPSRAPLVLVSSADSHASPAVQTTPKAIPKPILPATSSVSDGAAWAMHETASSTPAPSVIRCAPSRSAAIPAGSETANIASPGSASSSAVWEAVSP